MLFIERDFIGLLAADEAAVPLTNVVNEALDTEINNLAGFIQEGAVQGFCIHRVRQGRYVCTPV